MIPLSNKLLAVIIAGAIPLTGLYGYSIRVYGVMPEDALKEVEDEKTKEVTKVPFDPETHRHNRIIFSMANIPFIADEAPEELGSRIYEAMLFITTEKHGTVNGADLMAAFADKHVKLLAEDAAVLEAVKTLPDRIIDEVGTESEYTKYGKSALSDLEETLQFKGEQKALTSSTHYKALKTLLG